MHGRRGQCGGQSIRLWWLVCARLLAVQVGAIRWCRHDVHEILRLARGLVAFVKVCVVLSPALVRRRMVRWIGGMRGLKRVPPVIVRRVAGVFFHGERRAVDDVDGDGAKRS